MSSISSVNSLASQGINLSQILQAATGAASPGIDVNEAVSAAVTAAEEPETNWENQQSTLQSQSSALTQLQTSATNLDNDVQALNSLTGAFSTSSVSSSNSGLVTASAASGAAAGNNVVVVTSLATTSSWASNSVADATTVLPTQNLTITGSNGTATTISTSGDNLTQLAAAINGKSLGVTASVITDATGSRLAITSNTSGAAANFSVSASGSGLSFTQPVTGANAQLTVNGISVQSATNTVSGVIPGVTLNLLGASPGTEVSLSVAPDTSAASSAINQFVSDYNTLIGQVNTQFTDTAGSGQGPLADDASVRTLQSDLLGALSYIATPASGSTTTTVSGLSSLGITVNSDGTLTVDSGTLSNTLQNNFSDVQNFFQGSSLNGFANTLDQQLTSFISPATGAFTVDLKNMSDQYDALQTDITNFQTNTIEPLQTQLQAEFSKAEIALQQLPNDMKNVSAELGIKSS